jgi:hypothetical protein
VKLNTKKHQREVERFQKWFKRNACSLYSVVAGKSLQQAWDESMNIRDMSWYYTAIMRSKKSSAASVLYHLVNASALNRGGLPVNGEKRFRERSLCNAFRALVPVPPAFRLPRGRQRHY